MSKVPAVLCFSLVQPRLHSRGLLSHRNNRRISFLLVLLLFGSLALGADFDIYIYNKPFHARTFTKDKTLYVSLNDLSKALGVKVETGKDGLTVNGKPFPSVAGKDGTVYVPLKPFVEASGNKFLYNKQTRMIDVVPGSSTLTNSVVQNLEDSAVFNEPPPVGASPQQGGSPQAVSSPGKPEIQPPNLSAEIEALKTKYSKNLSAQADLLQYFGNLQNWANQEQDSKAQFTARLMQIKQNPNRDQALQQFATLFQSLGAQVTQSGQTFDAIAPPAQFQNSHSILRQIVESNNQLLPLISDFSHLMLAARTANPDELSNIMSRLGDLMRQLHQIEAVQNQLSVNYLRAFQTDLNNLPSK